MASWLNTPWYYGWNIIAVCLVFQALIFGAIFFSYTLWVGEWLNDASLAVTLTQVMIPITLLNLAQSFIAPLAGYAMDRYAIRVLICIGAVGAGIGYCLIAVTTAFWQIIAIYATLIMAGVLLSGPLAAQVLAARWFNRRRGLAIGVSTTGTSIGGVVMAPLVSVLYESMGWRDAHFVLGILFMAVILPVVLLIVRNGPADLGLAGDEPTPDSDAAAAASVDAPSRIWRTAEILRERTFWIIVLAFLPLVTAFGSVQQHLRPYAEGLGFDAMETAFLVSVFASVMIMGKLFFGLLADRFDRRHLFSLAIASCWVVIFGLLFSPGYPLLTLLTGLLGFAAGGFLPLLGAMVAARFGPASFGSVTVVSCCLPL